MAPTTAPERATASDRGLLRAKLASSGTSGPKLAGVLGIASVGRKPQLLLAVHDMALAEGPAPVPMGQRGYVQAVREAPTAAAMIQTYAAAMARVLPRSVPIMRALREAGVTEPDCAAQHDALSERRAANMGSSSPTCERPASCAPSCPTTTLRT